MYDPNDRFGWKTDGKGTFLHAHPFIRIINIPIPTYP